MFGLMVKKACGVHEEAREQYRLHYCGTCKAIGKQYSQSARMFLNYDCVFLAEVMTALSAEDTAAWHDSYQAYPCLAAGGKDNEMPLPLRFAATANVLLSALKTDDNLKDSPAISWRLMKRWFNADFEKAEEEMVRFGVDMDDIWAWIACQQQREKEKDIPNESKAALGYFAEPTARITAAIFSKGAALTGHNHDAVYRFGYQLGELIYIMDALEDEASDKKKNNFNALERIYHTVDKETKQTIAAYIHLLTQKIKITIQQLPLPDVQKEEYRQRFSTNVMVRVSNALEEKKPLYETVKHNLFTRLGLRAQKAKSFAQYVTQDKPTLIASPQYALTYMAVLIAPNLPQQLTTATEHNVFTAPAFAAVVTGFFSALFFRPKIRRFIALYKKELKRLRENRKKKPKKGWEPWEVAVFIGAIVAVILIITCCCLDIGRTTNDGCFEYNSSSDGVSCKNE